jgi:membrane-associated phospholipid phosphatase
VAVAVWTLVVLVGVSRVWLGVHWTSEVVAAIALAVLGVALAERLVVASHRGRGCAMGRR